MDDEGTSAWTIRLEGVGAKMAINVFATDFQHAVKRACALLADPGAWNVVHVERIGAWA